MAVLFLNNGNMETICAAEGKEGEYLEILIHESMGHDAAQYFHEYREEMEQGQNALEQEFKVYEGICDSQRSCLVDIQDTLEALMEHLKRPRTDRKRIQRDIVYMLQQISNEL